jgi:hypothetical protein
MYVINRTIIYYKNVFFVFFPILLANDRGRSWNGNAQTLSPYKMRTGREKKQRRQNTICGNMSPNL